jgi:hypothetical protein
MRAFTFRRVKFMVKKNAHHSDTGSDKRYLARISLSVERLLFSSRNPPPLPLHGLWVVRKHSATWRIQIQAKGV